MGEDISTGAKIGIILIILCALIAIVFALLTMMRNITNSGSGQLQNGLDQMQNSQFQDYDNKIVTGTQVMSAMKIFEGQPVGFIVRTVKNKTKGTPTKCQYPAAYGCAMSQDATKATIEPWLKDGVAGAKCDDYTAAAHWQIADKSLAKSEGDSKYILALYQDSGSYVYNMNTKPCTAAGSCTYIRGAGKFMSSLIYDETDQIIGIYFDQQK